MKLDSHNVLEADRGTLSPSAHPPQGNRGFTLMEVLLGAGILAVVALGYSATLPQHRLIRDDVRAITSLTILREKVRKELSCYNTLGLSPTVSLPVSCPDGKKMRMWSTANVEMTSADFLGTKWEGQGRCYDNNIKFLVRRYPTMATGAKSASDKRANSYTFPKLLSAYFLPAGASPSVDSWFDLYDGISDFCREYLDPQFANCDQNSQYPIYLGRTDQGATCCRVFDQTPASNAVLPKPTANLSCTTSEYLHGGSIRCNSYGAITGLINLNAQTVSGRCVPIVDTAVPKRDWIALGAVCCPKP